MKSNMTFIEYLNVQKQWEREIAPLVRRIVEDPDVPPISKSYELTRYVRGKINHSDLRWHSRKEILWAARFVWHRYKYALEDGNGETWEESPVLWA